MRPSIEPWLIAGALATFPCEGCGDRLKASLWEKSREPARFERDPNRY